MNVMLESQGWNVHPFPWRLQSPCTRFVDCEPTREKLLACEWLDSNHERNIFLVKKNLADSFWLNLNRQCTFD